VIHSFVRVKNTCSFSGSFSGLGKLSSYICTGSICGKYLSGEKTGVAVTFPIKKIQIFGNVEISVLMIFKGLSRIQWHT